LAVIESMIVELKYPATNKLLKAIEKILLTCLIGSTTAYIILIVLIIKKFIETYGQY